MGDVELGILGAVRLVVGGRPVTPRRGEQQLLLARLAVDAGRPVAASDLLDAADEGVDPLRPAERVADDLRDVTDALRRADPARCRLERDGTTFTLHVGPGVLDLDRFRARRDEGLQALAAHDVLAAEDHLRAAIALFPRPALADLGGRWARRTRDALEVESLEAHVVLADLLRDRRYQPDAAGAEEVMARFFLPTFGLWEALVRTRLDAGPDDVLAAAVRTAPVVFGARYDDPEADTLGALLGEAAERVLPGRTAGRAVPHSVSAPPLELTLYGPFRVRRHGTDATPTQPERVAVLAALVVGRGTVVPYRDLAAAGWPGRPADDVRAAVRRSVLSLAGLTSTTRPRVTFTEHADGWQLDLPDPCTDADHAGTLLHAGTDLLTQGAARSAVEPLAVAADMCARRALDSLQDRMFDVPRGRLEVLAETVAQRLADALVDGVLVGGEDPEGALSRLETLVGRHPGLIGLRERLMTGHHLTGHPFDAVGVHETAVRDLGPAFTGRSADAMRTLHQDITRARAARRASGVRFRVLDGTGLDVLGRPVTLATRDARRALAVLLLRRRSVVTSAELVDAVWDGRTAAPESAARWIVDSLLHNVELATQPVFGTPSEAEREARQSPLTVTAVVGGWVADLPPESLDLDVVAALAAQGTAAWGRGDAAAAADALRDAIGKLPEQPFPRLGGPWFDAERARLVTWRAELVALAVRAELACGRYADTLPDLEWLVAARPQDEDLTGELVTALAAVGRTADARAAYDRCAAALRRTLGTSPGPTLQMLLRRLTGE